MILSDTEIRAALDNGALIIDPRPSQEQISPSAIDLTLGNEFKRWAEPGEGAAVIIDPGDPKFSYHSVAKKHAEQMPREHGGTVLVPPGELVLGITRERVELPPRHRLAGRVEGRSTLGRLGLTVHVTAPTIHAGFRGQITLEIVNLGKLPIRLRPGMTICQLIVEHVFGTPASELRSVFQDQASPTAGPKRSRKKSK